MSREAMQLALEALELYQSKSSVQMFDDAVKALRQALETEQEPVAWRFRSGTWFNREVQWRYIDTLDGAEGLRGLQPLYTAPPKQWVGLTEEEIDALSQARSLTDELMDCVDRLGSEADTVDPRVWQHLLVYAPKPEEEPVAWISESDNLLSWDKFYDHMKPLYTAPPKREWVGLTLSEAEDFYEKYTDRAELINAIDKFLEEKNT